MNKSVEKRLRFKLVVEQILHMANTWFYYHKKKKSKWKYSVILCMTISTHLPDSKLLIFLFP